MAGYRVVYSATARRDLFSIGEYLQVKAGPRVAERWVDRIISTAESLATMPQRHRTRDELGEGVRVVSFRRYLLFYRVDAEAVVIVRVLHGSRRITAQLLRK